MFFLNFNLGDKILECYPFQEFRIPTLKLKFIISSHISYTLHFPLNFDTIIIRTYLFMHTNKLKAVLSDAWDFVFLFNSNYEHMIQITATLVNYFGSNW